MTTLSSDDRPVEVDTQMRPGFADELHKGMTFTLTTTAAASGILSPGSDQITIVSVRPDGKRMHIVGIDTDGQPTSHTLDTLRTVFIHSGPVEGDWATVYETGGTAERAVLIDVIEDLRRLAEIPGGLIHDEITALADRYAQTIADA